MNLEPHSLHLNFLYPLGLSDMSTHLVQPFKCLPTSLAEVDPPGGALPMVVDHVPFIRALLRVALPAKLIVRGFWLVWVSFRHEPARVGTYRYILMSVEGAFLGVLCTPFAP